MPNDLYFIPILAHALERKNVQNALLAAFEKIHDMGRERQYSIGHAQFRRFVREIFRNLEEDLPEETDRSPGAQILLEKDGRTVGQCVWGNKPSDRGIIRNVTPGIFGLKLDTGLVLWDGEFCPSDVLWAEAHYSAKKPLAMAADTEGSSDHPTREVFLENLGLVLRCYAGIESGRLEIQRIDRGTKDR